MLATEIMLGEWVLCFFLCAIPQGQHAAADCFKYFQCTLSRETNETYLHNEAARIGAQPKTNTDMLGAFATLPPAFQILRKLWRCSKVEVQAVQTT
eukprot:827647-Rhodomonas_salina.1